MGENSDLNIWKDPWVPGIDSFKPIPCPAHGDSNPNLKVKDLLHLDSLQWNERLIREVCDEASAEAILHLPPPLNTEFDSPCWLLSQDNSFSIKNAYLEILKSQNFPFRYSLSGSY